MSDGRALRMTYDESWGGIADFVCADAWYGDALGYPRFDEAPGCSSPIVTRTTTGEDLLRRADTAGYIVCEGLDAAEIARMQPTQAKRGNLVASRLAANALLGRPPPRFQGFDLLAAARHAGLWETIRCCLGSLYTTSTCQATLTRRPDWR